MTKILDGYSFPFNDSAIGRYSSVSSVGLRRSDLKITPDNSYYPEYNRYTFKNMSEFATTKEISKGNSKEFFFEKKMNNDINNIKFLYPTTSECLKSKISTISEMIHNTRTDSLVILKNGVLVYEEYFDGQNENTKHQMMSVTKSFIGILGACLIDEGLLKPNVKVTNYIPELKKTAYSNATVQQVLDMLVNINYSEEYDNPEAEFFNYIASVGFSDYTPKYSGSKNIRGVLSTLTSISTGDKFHYVTPTTEVIGWLIERATNITPEKMISDKIWSQLGMKSSAYIINDTSGVVSCGGGLSATALDLAKFGQMLLNKGTFNNKQIIPSSIIDELMNGGDTTAYKALTINSTNIFKSYKNQFWIFGDKNKRFAAIGIYGQWIYIDPTESIVIVKQSSLPQAEDEGIDIYTVLGFEAITDYLKNF